MVTLDLSTDDGVDVETELYENYREAEVRFKGNLNDGYEPDYCFPEPKEPGSIGKSRRAETIFSCLDQPAINQNQTRKYIMNNYAFKTQAHIHSLKG